MSDKNKTPKEYLAEILDFTDDGYPTFKRNNLIGAMEAYAAQALAEREEDRWMPIAEYPKDNPVVERWHKIYKCTVSVKHRRAYSDQCEWITGTLDHTWPEEAFEPFFRLLPTPPNE